MSSGNPSTSASNSFMRQAVHAVGLRKDNAAITLANIKLSLTMGDDLVGQGHMTSAVIDSFSSRGALIDDAELVVDFTKASVETTGEWDAGASKVLKHIGTTLLKKALKK